ncbi:hypothetical protein L873DRAFT_1796126 [Choiromyces venosus 120613-1]|uniref:Uncharacterized protein n=1 Tax=Choiromyces venosus 120613-1 TaxID=1336337 RepID=A0A3N4IT73_9PEZI|nr:hypothetical protein L873DRAFT_1796126 [Choiromyces venosus 120613-1]
MSQNATKKQLFEPAIKDSLGCYGDIVYAKGWCGFLNLHTSMAVYVTWHQEVQTYLKGRSLDNHCMRDSKLVSAVIFACAIPLIMSRIELVRDKHWAYDIEQVNHHRR